MNRPENKESNLTGIPTEHVEATKELATFGTTIVTESGNLARYVGAILGTAPHDAVGIMLGEPLHAVRTLVAGALHMKVQRKLELWGVRETQPVSPSVAIPLIRAAYDESREELQNLWAALIAAAMDPARASRVRLSFIETLRQFDPLDALVLRTYTEIQGIENNNDNLGELARRVVRADDEVWLSIENLQRLNCFQQIYPVTPRRVLISRYGRALVHAVSD
jgi:hypothetical protein